MIYRKAKKVTQRFERKIIETVYDSPQSSSSSKKRPNIMLPMKSSEMFLKNTTNLQEWLGNNPAVSTKCRKEITIYYRTCFTSFGVLG